MIHIVRNMSARKVSVLSKDSPAHFGGACSWVLVTFLFGRPDYILGYIVVEAASVELLE